MAYKELLELRKKSISLVIGKLDGNFSILIGRPRGFVLTPLKDRSVLEDVLKLITDPQQEDIYEEIPDTDFFSIFIHRQMHGVELHERCPDAPFVFAVKLNGPAHATLTIRGKKLEALMTLSREAQEWLSEEK